MTILVNKLQHKSLHDIAHRHQLRIARQTLHMPDAIVKVMGEMTKEEAKKILNSKGGEDKGE